MTGRSAVQWKVVIHVRDGRRVGQRVEQRGDRALFGMVRRRQMQRQPSVSVGQPARVWVGGEKVVDDAWCASTVLACKVERDAPERI